MNAMPEPRTPVRSAEPNIERRIRDASRKLSSIDRDVQRFVQTRPMTAALAALAAGFVLGRIASRL